MNIWLLPSQTCDIDFGWYEAIRDELLRKTVGESSSVLDIGCGRGKVLLMLSKQIGHGIGIDRSKEEIRFAQRTCVKRGIGNISFCHADATKLPFRAESFNVVMLLGDVLSYPGLYGKHPQVLAELRRVLRKNGLAIHESMNWEWEYKLNPYWTYFTRKGDDHFHFHRVSRTPSGHERCRSYEVIVKTPLYAWLKRHRWPISFSGHAVSLTIAEKKPISNHWLIFKGISRHQHYTPRSLRILYENSGFRDVKVFSYGQTYDIICKARLLKEAKPFQTKLAKAEAETIMQLQRGSGPWLFLTARK